MLEYMPYIWIAVILISVVVEGVTADLVSIWFIPSGVIALILSVLPIDAPVWAQTIVFFACALVLAILSKTIFKEFFKKSPIVPTNLDAVIGMDAVVVETINDKNGVGAVRVAGKVWSAIAEDGDGIIEKNELVTVKEIQGVKLVCIKKSIEKTEEK